MGARPVKRGVDLGCFYMGTKCIKGGQKGISSLREYLFLGITLDDLIYGCYIGGD